MQNSSRWYKRKWKSLESCLSEPRGRESVERFSRRQQELKARLLRYYNSCAITGEKNTDALEAAHIVSVAGDGADTELNAILLRADIHRLYDRDYFVIDANGQIHTRKPLSAQYKAIFRRKKALDHAVLSIVKDALALRGDA